MMKHIIIAGLGFGDEGKGTITDYLCSTGNYHTVVRYNGGVNAGHNVIRSGRQHTFSQFGSGTFHPGVTTHLSRFMLVDPLGLAAEFEHLKSMHISDAIDRLTIDENALLTTPWHREANRVREMQRGENRHGSCGTGVGETMSYSIKFPDQAPLVKDCLDSAMLEMKLSNLRKYLEDELGILRIDPTIHEVSQTFWEFAHAVKIVREEYLHNLLNNGSVIFEGAQGILLDQNYGFAPYNTWSATTFHNADQLLSEAGHQGYRLGIIRAFATRHGAGPFPTEDPNLKIPDPNNTEGPWQGQFRVGHFDAVMLRYALKVSEGVHGIAVTHLDTAQNHEIKLCQTYDTAEGRISDIPVMGRPQPEILTQMLTSVSPVYQDKYLEWPKIIQNETGIPVIIESSGPTARDKTMIRNSEGDYFHNRLRG